MMISHIRNPGTTSCKTNERDNSKIIVTKQIDRAEESAYNSSIKVKMLIKYFSNLW